MEHQSSHLSVNVSFVEIGRKIQFYCQFSSYGNYPKFSDTPVWAAVWSGSIYFL